MVKVVAKHKLKIRGDPEAERMIHKVLFRSVRNKVLQKLLLVYANLWYFDWSLHREVEKRLLKKNLVHAKVNFAYEVTPEEVMEILGCSRRTAVEYIDALKVLMG